MKITKLSDLKNGMVVEIRNGNRYLVLDNFLIRNKSRISLDSFNEDMTSKNNYDHDINEIFITEIGSFESMLKGYLIKDIVYKRLERKKMTIREIEAELGYNIEIIGE